MWGATRRKAKGLPLRGNLKPRVSGVFDFRESGATPTAWCCVGIGSPQRCVSLKP